MPRGRQIVGLRGSRWITTATVVALATGTSLALNAPARPARAAASPGVTERVSVDTAGRAGTGGSVGGPSMSADGRYVAFATYASLDPLDTNGAFTSDVYVRDTAAGTTTLISRGRAPVTPGFAAPGTATLALPGESAADGPSTSPSISADGRYVAFGTNAGNIDGSSGTHVTVGDRDPDGDGVFDESFRYVSFSRAPSQYAPRLSGDGRWLAMVEYDSSAAPNTRVVRVPLRFGANGVILTPAAGNFAPVLAAPTTDGPHGSGTYTLTAEASPNLSTDGRHVTFQAVYATPADPYSDFFLFSVVDYDAATDTASRLDLDEAGMRIGNQDRYVSDPVISGDGRRVAFVAAAPEPAGTVVQLLDRDPDGDGVFGPAGAEPVRSEVVSRAVNGAVVGGRDPAFSADGRYLAYATDAAGVHNGVDDPSQEFSCVHRPPDGLVARTAPRLGGAVGAARGPGRPGAGAGRPAVARALAPTGISWCDVVVRDLVVDERRQAAQQPRLPAELASPSRLTSCAGFVAGETCEGGGDSDAPVLTADGSAVAYVSEAGDLVAGDAADTDTFLRRFTPTLRSDPADFGAVVVGSDATLVVPVSHAGFGPLGVVSVSVTGPQAADFTVFPVETCSGTVLHATEECLVSVRFRPAATGVRDAALLVLPRGTDVPVRIPLTGTGSLRPPPGKPGFRAAPDPLDFGVRPVLRSSPARTVTVTNTGTAALHVGATALVPETATTFPGDYGITVDTCTGATVPAGGTCRVTLVHTPRGVGPRSALLRFDDDASGPHLVVVRGAGARPVLDADPPLAPPGRVSSVSGRLFPPNRQVELTLPGMPGRTSATTDANGSFRVPLVILPHTAAGRRVLRGTVSGLTPAVVATTPYLVVYGTLQPPDFSVRN